MSNLLVPFRLLWSYKACLFLSSGPGNPFSATVGYPWLKAITDLFASGPNTTASEGNFVPPPLIMGFTVSSDPLCATRNLLTCHPKHDNNLPPVVSALGVWNTSSSPGVYPLSTTRADPRRKFRSSFLVSFRGYVALERLSCDPHAPPTSVRHTSGQVALGPGTSAGAQKYVRLKVRSSLSRDNRYYLRGLSCRVAIRLGQINDAVVPLPGCAEGPGSSCALASFEAYVAKRAAVAGDFVQRCGLEGVKNATGVLDIFTNVPSTIGQSSILTVPLPYASAL